ncbi:MAG: helix-turn-helix transcriptional regulator [Candidatus Omnitrophota bacterium]
MKRMFWDKNISENEVKQILKDDKQERFVYFAAMLLSRANTPQIVFEEFLEKKCFVKSWQRIKRKMRENKWNDNRIIFWDAIYKVLKDNPEYKNIKSPGKGREIVSKELEKIGGQVRAMRAEKRITQRALAIETGVSQQTISLIERGYSNISFSTLEKIATAVGLTVSISVYPAEKISFQMFGSANTSS